MSQTSATIDKPKSAWIISPTWDLAYLVATPIVIVPVVWVVARWLMTPEHLYLAVISFASLGHHLPGFMRCYGDRELFARFKWRFLLVPPMFALTGWYFSWYGLHGLSLVILLWATWHGLMQTYGFMRIYDLKRGVRDAYSARLDFWLCLSIFWAGLVYSDGRVFHFMEALWKTGTPAIDASWLAPTRWITGCAFGFLLAVYVLNMLRTSRAHHGVSWAKILLAITTGGTYWITGVVTTNIVIGVAIFEIFHAVQYYAIVWTYNRRLAERVGTKFGPLGFLFQDRWFFLGIYLAAIFAFGSINYFGDTVQNEYIKLAMMVVIITSTLLHYYYDGFIWKVRERKTQENLDIHSSTDKRSDSSSRSIHVPALVHAGKLTLLYAILIGLVFIERNQSEPPGNNRLAMTNHLASWTPDLPESKVFVGDEALRHGDAMKAIRLAHEVIQDRPRMTLGYDLLTEALLADKQYAAAIEQLKTLILLDANRWKPHFNLAVALEETSQRDQAETEIEIAIKLAPKNAELRHSLGKMYLRQEAYDRALPELLLAATWQPESDEFLNSLAKSYFTLGTKYIIAGEYAKAENALLAFLKLKPDSHESAEANYNLGVALFEQMKDNQAIAAYQRAIELKPDYALCLNNLAMLYYELGRYDEARPYVVRARQHGIQPPLEVIQRLGL